MLLLNTYLKLASSALTDPTVIGSAKFFTQFNGPLLSSSLWLSSASQLFVWSPFVDRYRYVSSTSVSYFQVQSLTLILADFRISGPVHAVSCIMLSALATLRCRCGEAYASSYRRYRRLKHNNSFTSLTFGVFFSVQLRKAYSLCKNLLKYGSKLGTLGLVGCGYSLIK